MTNPTYTIPDISGYPTVTFANGGQMRRVDDQLEARPVGAPDWQPVAWLTLADLPLFVELIPHD